MQRRPSTASSEGLALTAFIPPALMHCSGGSFKASVSDLYKQQFLAARLCVINKEARQGEHIAGAQQRRSPG